MSDTAQLHAIGNAALPVTVRQHLRVVSLGAHSANACERCALGAVCLPQGLAEDERQEYMALILQRKRLRAAEALYRAGDPFDHLYFVKTGSFKTVLLLEDGREQITGFHFAGDVLGIDAISSPHHPSEAIALEDASVCAIPFAQLTRLSRRVGHLQSYVQRLLARELVRDQGLMLLLGRMHASERVVVFLRNLSNRFRARGCSPHEFTLPMAREDIGNYLGLTLETVSRCFSRLKNAGVIEVDNRHIRIPSIEALQQTVDGAERTEHRKTATAAR